MKYFNEDRPLSVSTGDFSESTEYSSQYNDYESPGRFSSHSEPANIHKISQVACLSSPKYGFYSRPDKGYKWKSFGKRIIGETLPSQGKISHIPGLNNDYTAYKAKKPWQPVILPPISHIPCFRKPSPLKKRTVESLSFPPLSNIECLNMADKEPRKKITAYKKHLSYEGNNHDETEYIKKAKLGGSRDLLWHFGPNEKHDTKKAITREDVEPDPWKPSDWAAIVEHRNKQKHDYNWEY